ncbi:hypothetical protein KPL78_00975 [Roseomonas sp. HJA6]|uniref:Uncharacterized protein n=1 Tax=Roseomonas alba TaxID=2846776 RepID=A0ABS7A296_9PROT|nr:hypothetical protein [Neoroseomonas alba]MBW6396393.1 hypothetical protein [Neoroseomonas alba]
MGRKKKKSEQKPVQRTLSAALNGDLPDVDGSAIRIMALHRFIELGGGRWAPKAYPHGAPPADDDPHMTTEQILETGGTVPIPHNLKIKRAQEASVTFEPLGRGRTDGAVTVGLAWSHQILILAACGACLMHDLPPPVPADCEALARALDRMKGEASTHAALTEYRDGHEHRRLRAAEEAFAEPQPQVAGSDIDGMFAAARDLAAERALAVDVARWNEEARDARSNVRAALAEDGLTHEMLAAPVALTEDDEEDAAFKALYRLLFTAKRVKRGKDQPGGQLRDALRRHMKAMREGVAPHPVRGWRVGGGVPAG